LLGTWRSVTARRRNAAPFGFAAVVLAGLLAPASPVLAAPTNNWTFTKAANPTTYATVGQTINYTYTIVNTTDSTGHITSVTDTKVAAVNCPTTVVGNHATVVCTGTYTITLADVIAGSVTNSAEVKGDSCNDSCTEDHFATATITFIPAPSWKLTKTPSPKTYTAAGQAIAYSYVLTNTGNTVIASITITDNKVTPVTCPSDMINPGASMTCTGTYTTKAADVTAGSVKNTATASGIPEFGSLSDVTAHATITFKATPTWTLTKTPDPKIYTAAGQAINYTYVLKNTGNTSISAIKIADDKIATVTCPATTLAVGVSMTCTGTYTTRTADLSAGSVTNTATATGTPSSGTLAPATAQATITFGPRASWALTKTPNPTTYSAAGQSIKYTYVLTNTGNVRITAISLTDNKIAEVSCPATAISPSKSMTCTGDYTTTAHDVTAGSVVNKATATGIAGTSPGPAAPKLPPVSATAKVTFKATGQGSITIIKTASGGNDRFNFTSSVGSAASFVLATSGGKAMRTFTSLKAGTYSFTEVSLPLHWKLADLSCTGDTGGKKTTVSLGTRTATVGLDDGEAITCTFVNLFDEDLHRHETKEVIKRFLSHRLTLLLDEEPDRPRLIRRSPGTLWDGGAQNGAAAPFTMSGGSDGLSTRLSFATSMSQMAQAQANADARDADKSQQAMAYAPGDRLPVKAWPKAVPSTNPVDVWMEAHFSQFKANAGGVDNSGHFGVVYLGADYLVNPGFLVGALLQVDSMTESSKSLNSDVRGTGAMAGPYVSARISENFFFDARTAWGLSDNRINPFGTYQDKFSTNRWLSSANLTGNWAYGNLRVTPSAGLTFIQEMQQSYVDSLGVLISGQTVSLGRFKFGPEFAYRIDGANGTTYEPHVSISGIWDFDRPQTDTIDGLLIGPNAFHVMTQFGILARSANGYSLRLAGSYDGLGSSTFHDVGGQIWLNVPFN
jgi:hypothetical protein